MKKGFMGENSGLVVLTLFLLILSGMFWYKGDSSQAVKFLTFTGIFVLVGVWSYIRFDPELREVNKWFSELSIIDKYECKKMYEAKRK